MAKPRVSYLCRQCGGVQAQWMGKCPDCGTWDALEKYIEPKAAKSGASGMLADEATGEPDDRAARPPVAEPLTAVKAGEVSRLSTGIGELDRVLGGGLVPGSAVLVGGDPGIGKSTLLLQAAARLAESPGEGPGKSRSAGRSILYVSSEESAYQTRLRAERLFGDGDGEKEGRGGRLPHSEETEDGLS
ncbi:MAG: AAA family ATPase, partial [Phycisphaerales bacterium]|nr:AAA family ATPase [Phycisphaerales bacterium]